ncbi:MAG: sensor histidine kinase [Cyclobacteriaceae bacterium]|jgi:signal transduction histidine kinase
MLARLWTLISQIGVNSFESWTHNRYIILTNRVSLLVCLFILLLDIVAISVFGIITSTILPFAAALVILLPIVFNAIGLFDLARIFLCITIPLSSVVVSIFDKMDVPGAIETFQFYEFRLTLLASTIFPFVLFQLNERLPLIGCLVFNFLLVFLYDPIHEFFGVGFFTFFNESPNYDFVNYIMAFSFITLVGCTYFLKYSFEEYEEKNHFLISNLHKVNDSLSEKTQALARHQNELLEANAVIENQRQLLARENLLLNRELVDKNTQLVETNEELIQHNNDLLQFSYTVSHNLRGPVASLIGLLNLIDAHGLNNENATAVHFLKKSVNSLDATIKDLSTIIDIRNKISAVKHQVRFQHEMEHVLTLLRKEIADNQVRVETHFEDCPEIYSVKAMVNSILYNLISNAIKYRDLDRQPFIRVTAKREGELVRLEVEDNGLGLDVDRFREKLFGLYKRFHTHTEGKGLGLFLVKLQAEALGGRVDVHSELNRGTRFLVWMRTNHETVYPALELQQQNINP